MHLRSFPHYQQQEAADCGPSCLRMIAKYYGKAYSAEMLRKHCFISREGVSLLGISDAAEVIGMRTVGVQITFDQLVTDALFPCILHWNQNHFVVCYGVEKRRKWGRRGRSEADYILYIADPANQKVKLTRQEFEHCWLSSRNSLGETGIALMLEPGVDFGKADDEFQTSRKSI